MTHPMGRTRGGGLSLGCLGILVIVGLVVGIGAYITFGIPGDDSKSSDADRVVSEQNLDDTESQADVDGGDDVFIQPVERHIYFPNAETAGTVVTAYRKPGGWEVSNLQQLVGHLEGTPWLGQSGNIVLAGHFEDELGRPGPFRYLYFAEVGDRIMLQEGNGPLHVYVVSEVFRTDPNDLEVLRKSDYDKLTLITCDSWSYESEAYEQRLVVVAQPVGTLDTTTSITSSETLN